MRHGRTLPLGALSGRNHARANCDPRTRLEIACRSWLRIPFATRPRAIRDRHHVATDESLSTGNAREPAAHFALFRLIGTRRNRRLARRRVGRGGCSAGRRWGRGRWCRCGRDGSGGGELRSLLGLAGHGERHENDGRRHQKTKHAISLGMAWNDPCSSARAHSYTEKQGSRFCRERALRVPPRGRVVARRASRNGPRRSGIGPGRGVGVA